MSMEPVPETTEAVHELRRHLGAEAQQLLEELQGRAERVRGVVPDLVGVSLASLDDGIAFTLVASSAEIAVLDAIQYVAGGPCVEGAHAGRTVDFSHDDALDEDRWQLFAEATAAHAVRSTLTLPLMGRAEGNVEGTVNLYAASRRAFVGQHEPLAAIFGAWASGAVSNSDLSFTTRDQARLAPQRIRQQRDVAVALGIIAAQFHEDFEQAEERLRDAAARAGTVPADFAREIVRARRLDGHDQA